MLIGKFPNIQPLVNALENNSYPHEFLAEGNGVGGDQPSSRYLQLISDRLPHM